MLSKLCLFFFALSLINLYIQIYLSLVILLNIGTQSYVDSLASFSFVFFLLTLLVRFCRKSWLSSGLLTFVLRH